MGDDLLYTAKGKGRRQSGGLMGRVEEGWAWPCLTTSSDTGSPAGGL